MHYYICPYCAPCAEATLIKVKSKIMKCKYDKEEDCGEKHKCKEILKCKKCKEMLDKEHQKVNSLQMLI